ncbi:MAG: hypothetical protein MJB12_05690, partial [Firmicutes bacterium]|nr:hypothetical protein [Bacillota bacterium]
TVGALSGNSVIDVPVGTKVSALKAGLTVSLKAAAEILTGTGGSAVTDQANTNVTKDMMIEVTAEDGSRKEYSIYLKTGTPPVLSSEKEIKSTAIGTLSGNSVIDVPVGTKVSSLKAGLTVSPKAAAEIFTGTGGSAVTDQANTDVTETMVIEVAAEDGSKKEYDIRLKPVTPALSSEKEIKSTAIGTLSGNSVIDVPAGTKVSSLKAGLTVSDKAAAEILTGTGGSAVTDQANTDVTKDMVIEVTAEDGSKKEYGIATVTYVDIDSIEDLRNIADNDSAGKVYRLIKDLDFDDDASYEDVNSKTDPSIANWRPIEGFDGIFDGGNHKIGNLKMNRNDTSQGLFKCIYSEAIIKDLILVDVNVKNIGYITGALAGGMKGGLIINCHVSGTITGERAVGGIVGQIEKTAAGVMGCIKGCSSSADITGSDAQIGGIAGVSAMITGTVWGSIQDCYSTGNITGTYAVGGIAGQSVRTFTLRCYSTGTISGKGEIGGIIGSAAVVHICDCYSTGTVIGDSKYIGGISGNISSDSTVYGCYSTALVKGNEYTGGIVGSSKKSRIENCFAMNPQLDGTIVARVIGFEEGATLSDNYGNANMLVNGSKVTGGAANNIDGADITVFDKDQAPLSQWDFTGDGGDFFHWVMDNDMDRPVLYVIDGNGGFEQIGSDDGRIALKLLALSPENDAADVDAGISELKLVFNKKMTKEPGKTITVCDAVYESVYSSPYEAAKITIGVSDGIVIDNNEIVIPIPSGLLKPDGEYYIHIDNEAFADERKNYFEGITSKTGWRFKVK